MRFLPMIAPLLLVGVLSGCQQASTDSAADVEAAPAEFNLTGAPTVEFSVSGMSCEAGCATKVRAILAEQPGVVDATVDFPNEKATVAVQETGFDAAAAIAALADYQFDAALLESGSEPVVEPADEGDVPSVAKPESES